MINLLPKEEIEEIKNEENLKIVLNLAIFLLLFLLLIFLTLLSIKFYFSGIFDSQKLILEEEEKGLDLESEKEIERYNLLLSKIDSYNSQKIYFFSFFEEISQILPEKIFLQNFSIELTPKKEISVNLSGFSPTREDLLELIKILKEKYTEVSFPPQILLKPVDIDFSFNLKIK